MHKACLLPTDGIQYAADPNARRPDRITAPTRIQVDRIRCRRIDHQITPLHPCLKAGWQPVVPGNDTHPGSGQVWPCDSLSARRGHLPTGTGQRPGDCRAKMAGAPQN